MRENAGGLHSLIPLEDFKALMGIDERDDAMARFCLIAATYTIEQHCMRRLALKRRHEYIGAENGLLLPLREYPVREVLSVHALYDLYQPEPLEPELYRLEPECGGDGLPCCIALAPAVGRLRGIRGWKAAYTAGYASGDAGEPCGVPADLASACLELAAWNFGRYKGKRVGVAGGARGGERLEAAMPENVRGLLEPHKRKAM